MSAYTARPLADGTAAVLEPDGLTWAATHPEPSQAERHAAALNAWLQARPTSGEPELIADAFADPAEPASPAQLEPLLVRALNRLCGPYDDRLPAQARPRQKR
ncbi:MAG: hypothetical protein DMD33_18765 [Gemmatimonadetes bacterium]|nr:MAG: hypothetical protein DMD33_18765 [Gemmatimonadota bacterium]